MYRGRVCRNIKYNIMGSIVGTGMMKINNEWVSSVTYIEVCRFSHVPKMFTKPLKDFEKEFELL